MMHKPQNQKIPEIYQFDYFNTYLDFSCFAHQLLHGLDLYGNEGDLVAFDESIEVELFENIKNFEAFKHAVNSIYLPHIKIARACFENDCENAQKLGIFGIPEVELDAWIDKVKLFYITVLADSFIFEQVCENGMCIEEIEYAIELLVKLEDFMVENYKETEGETWN